MRPPKAFRQTGLRSIEVRDGGGCVSLFGLPFLAAGLFLTAIGFGALPLDNASEVPGWAYPLIVLMGLAFAAAGGVLALGRRWTVLDLSRRKVIRQRGLLVPMWRRESSLDQYESVVLRHEAGDSDTPDTYPLVLRARGRAEDLGLKSAPDYASAREQARYLALFLNLPLEDASTDRISVLPPDRLDAPPAERLAPGEPELPPRPRAMHSTVEEFAEGARITIPGPGFKGLALLQAAIPIAILLYVGPRMWEFFERTETPRGVGIALLGFGAFFFGIVPLLSTVHSVLRGTRSRTVVATSPTGIVIEERAAVRTNTTRVGIEDIVGLDYHTAGSALEAATREASRRGGTTTARLPRWVEQLSRFVVSEGVTVKSNRGLFTFGAGLADDEVRYLEAVVRRALLGTPD